MVERDEVEALRIRQALDCLIKKIDNPLFKRFVLEHVKLIATVDNILVKV